MNNPQFHATTNNRTPPAMAAIATPGSSGIKTPPTTKTVKKTKRSVQITVTNRSQL